jgi:hypothetical protein
MVPVPAMPMGVALVWQQCTAVYSMVFAVRKSRNKKNLLMTGQKGLSNLKNIMVTPWVYTSFLMFQL